LSEKEKTKPGDKHTTVTPLETGWHHTEIVTEKGSERQHFTHEPTKKHFYKEK